MGMKWLSGGLTFVNFATVCALLFGMVAGGLGKTSALFSLCLGCAAAVLAYAGTSDARLAQTTVTKEPKRSRQHQKKLTSAEDSPRSYKKIWLWLIGLCFAIFAVRSFCWLLYIDGDQLRIQSPNNLGDIALHITYIRNFANGVALWPENPIYVSGAIRYPVGIDLFNALLVLAGIELRHGLIWVGLLASLATFYAFWRWAGSFGIAAFLFNGGVAGFQILHTWKWSDYQGVPSIAWKSIPLAMFVTQRGLLYAIPAGLLLLYHWRAKFFPAHQGAALSKAPSSKNVGGLKTTDAPSRRPPLPFWVECSLYASMPLFHVHTFMALSIALGFWFLIGKSAMRKQLLLLGGCAIIPATFFVWLVSNHFQASSVFAWQPGWVQTIDEFAKPFFEFWWANFGVWLPLILFFCALCIWRAWQSGVRSIFRLPVNLAFLIPAAAIFTLTCLIKFAPWEWDNTKVMIWAYFMILPFLWKDLIARWPQEVRVGLYVALFGSGFVSLMGGLAAPGYDLASRGEIDGVAIAVRNLPMEARFAAFPTYNHPLLLNGRKVVLGYPGHLWTQGFDFGKTNDELTSLMNGAVNWREIAHRLRVRYLFWGREEKTNYGTSTHPWEHEALCVANGSWGAIYDLEPTQTAPSPKSTN
jgi:hypothetical protein